MAPKDSFGAVGNNCWTVTGPREFGLNLHQFAYLLIFASHADVWINLATLGLDRYA
jgi:hypothetical protein